MRLPLLSPVMFLRSPALSAPSSRTSQTTSAVLFPPLPATLLLSTTLLPMSYLTWRTAWKRRLPSSDLLPRVISPLLQVPRAQQLQTQAARPVGLLPRLPATFLLRRSSRTTFSRT
ncbi:hypothetical protein C8R43DRAFT_982823 [Mycena crocata]|nr:hypothetical protein C8R43DRAFT_982823 [Mycena crocata]